MTEQPQQAGQPYDPRERDVDEGASSDERTAGEERTPEPGVDQEPGGDYG